MKKLSVQEICDALESCETFAEKVEQLYTFVINEHINKSQFRVIMFYGLHSIKHIPKRAWEDEDENSN